MITLDNLISEKKMKLNPNKILFLCFIQAIFKEALEVIKPHGKEVFRGISWIEFDISGGEDVTTETNPSTEDRNQSMSEEGGGGDFPAQQTSPVLDHS